MINSSRIKQSSSSLQGELLPTYPSDLVPEDHISRVLNEIVDTLDLRELYHKFSREGGSLFHPKSMLKLLFYGYSQGTRSSRDISQACQENVIFYYLGSGIKPNFRTISDFRKTHIDILKGLFKQIVHICYHLDMVGIGQISFDGTKIKANAADGKMVEKDKLAEELDRLEQEISQMFSEAEVVDSQEDAYYGEDHHGTELPERLQKAKDRKKELTSLVSKLDQQGIAKMSTTDQDARFMKSHGQTNLSYNGQCATEDQVILAYDLNNQQADTDQLPSMVSDLEQLSSELKGEKEHPLEDVTLIADAGYDSGKNHQYLAERKVDGYIASQKAKVKSKERKGIIKPQPFSKDKFIYHTDGDYYECPAHEKLHFVRGQKKAKKTYIRHERIYRGRTCHLCRFQTDCAKGKNGYRSITRYEEYDPYREQMDAKMATAEGRSIMKRRAIDVEPTFGQIKAATFRNNPFLLRGSDKAKGEYGLACIVHNIKKIAKYLHSNENEKKLADISKIILQVA